MILLCVDVCLMMPGVKIEMMLEVMGEVVLEVMGEVVAQADYRLNEDQASVQ